MIYTVVTVIVHLLVVIKTVINILLINTSGSGGKC